MMNKLIPPLSPMPADNPETDYDYTKELKVIVLGDSGAGKSLIVSRIMNPDRSPADYADHVISRGVNIQRWSCSFSNQNICVNFLDLDGTSIRLSLHRVFMTSQTLYMIILDTRSDSQDDQAQYWLNEIKRYAPGSPALLVLNKIDLNPNASLNLSALKKLHPNLLGVARISSTYAPNDIFHTDLVEPLQNAIAATADVLPPVPHSWLKLQHELESRRPGCVTADEIWELCDMHQIGSDYSDYDRFLHWLVNVSGCYCFVDHNHHMLVRTNWISNALFLLLDGRFPSKRHGMVSIKEIYHALFNRIERLEDMLFNRIRRWEDMQLILDTLRCFHISFRVNEEIEFLPILCDRNTNPIAEEYRFQEDILEFHVEFEHLPTHVIHQLMMDQIAHLDFDNIWYSGAHFIGEDQEWSALVESSKNTILIYMRSRDPHRAEDYLYSFHGHLRMIAEALFLRITDTKVAYKEGGLQDLFSYPMLLGSLSMGQPFVYSPVFQRLISISEVLKQPDEERISVEIQLKHDIYSACCQIAAIPQDRRSITENSLNDILRQFLWNRNYLIADQRLLKLPSRSGMHSGEVDILLMDEHRTPWTMIEGLRIKGSGRSSLRNWGDHLSLLLQQFTSTPMGLPAVFLVSYVECEKANYDSLWHTYTEHMRWYDPDRAARKKDSFSEIHFAENVDLHLRAAQCTYELRGQTVTVYHYFVRVPVELADEADPSETSPRQEHTVSPLPVPDAPAPKLQQKEQDSKPKLSDAQQKPDTEIVQHEYRVVFLGDSEAGKSLLMARVIDPEKGLAEFDGKTTPGIDIKHEYYDPDGHRIRINYWDFGGQEILHSLHRMFLSGKTLYVIVLNSRNDNHDAQAEFWMHYLETYSDAQVLFVLNKIDQNPKAMLNLPMLSRRFRKKFTEEDVIRICAIDEDHKKFKTEFTDKLVNRVTAAINFSDGYNSQTLKIRTEVEHRKKQRCVIKTDDFLKDCEAAGLTDENAQSALMNRFNQEGILVYFGTGYKVLLDPEWITKAIYKLLEKEEEISVNGIVSQKKLETLCRTHLGESEYAMFILEVMRLKKLSYQYQKQIEEDPESENLEFIPMLCKTVEPDNIEELTQTDNTMEMQMYFEYLPPSILYRLIVAVNGNAFVDGKLDTEFVWRSGAKFKFGELVYIIVRQDGNVMRIYAHHETDGTKEKALKNLKKIADTIKAETKLIGAKLQEIKLGYMIGTIMEYFDYDRLLSAQKSGIYYVASTVRDEKKIFVEDILNQTDSREQQLVQDMLNLCRTGCEQLIGNPHFWFPKTQLPPSIPVPKMDEDERTRKLGEKLRPSFHVAEQARWGESATGIKPGELDLKIDTHEGKTLAILEALIITGDNQKSRDNWIEHLERMMLHYNKNGFRHLLLVSYLNCNLKNRTNVQKAFLKLLMEHHVPEYGKPNVNPDIMPDCPNGLQVVQADYSSGAGKVSVYHFLVHIPKYDPTSSTPRPSKTDLM